MVDVMSMREDSGRGLVDVLLEVHDQRETADCHPAVLATSATHASVCFNNDNNKLTTFYSLNFMTLRITRLSTRVLAMALCLSQVGVLSKRLNESGWFWHGSFIPPIVHCIVRKFDYRQK